MRALASHQCGPGSIPGLGVICGLSLLLVLVLAPRGFSPGTPVFPSPQKPTFLNSNSIWKVSPISAVRAKYIWHLNKVHYYYYYCYLYLTERKRQKTFPAVSFNFFIRSCIKIAEFRVEIINLDELWHENTCFALEDGQWTENSAWTNNIVSGRQIRVSKLNGRNSRRKIVWVCQSIKKKDNF